MYQSDDLRVQLSMASTWVVTMNSGIVLIKLIGFASGSSASPSAHAARRISGATLPGTRFTHSRSRFAHT
jgi:hypothetical protein